MEYVEKATNTILYQGDILLRHPELTYDNFVLPEEYAEIVDTETRPITTHGETSEAVIDCIDGQYVKKWIVRQLTQEELDEVEASIAKVDAEIAKYKELALQEPPALVEEGSEQITPIDVNVIAGEFVINNNEEQTLSQVIEE